MKTFLAVLEDWGVEAAICAFALGFVVVYCCALAGMPWALHFCIGN